MKIKLKSALDNFDEASNETGLQCLDDSLTQQHDEHDANINNIVETYIRTGTLEGRSLPPLQGDFTMATTMQEALQLGVEARLAFMEQPAQIRSRFENDPAKFVDFCSNPDNSMDMYKMGLLNDDANQRIIQDQLRAEQQAARNKEDAEAFRRAQKAHADKNGVS